MDAKLIIGVGGEERVQHQEIHAVFCGRLVEVHWGSDQSRRKCLTKLGACIIFAFRQGDPTLRPDPTTKLLLNHSQQRFSPE